MADRNEIEILVRATDQTKGFADTKRGAKELTGEIAKVEAELKALSKIRSKAEIDADTKVAETKIAATASKLEELRSKPTSPKIEADIAVAERNLQKLETQLQGLKGEAAAQINVRADTAAAESKLAALKAEARELDGLNPKITPEVESGPAESKLAKFGDGAKTTVGVAGALAGGVFASGLANSLEFGAADAKLRAQMDWSPEFMAELGQTSGDLYAQGYGDSLGSVNEALRSVVTSGAVAEDATTEQISGITKSAMSLAEAFDVDVNQAMMAVSRMVSTDLVPSAEAGMDLITRSFQELGPGAEDVLDTLTEYPTQFQKAGLSGEAAMTMVKQMMDAGARSTDLAADAIKEFSIRAQDGSKASLDAYKAIGLNGEEMTKKFAKGGQDARDVMEQVIQKLREMPPGFERNQAAIGLFGTQAEDLGDALFAIDFDGVEYGLGKTEGAAQRLSDTLGDTAQNKVTQLQRGFEQWTAGLIETDGVVGDVATGIAAFGPQAMGALTALGPLAAMLKMNGIADAIRSGPGASIDDLGGRAGKQKGKVGDLRKALLLEGAADAIRSGPGDALDDLGRRADTTAGKVGKGGGGLAGALKGLGALAGGIGLAVGADELLPQDAGKTMGSQVARDMLGSFADYFNGNKSSVDVSGLLDWQRLFSNPVQIPVEVATGEFRNLLGLDDITVTLLPDGSMVENELAELKKEAARLHPEVNIEGRKEDAFQALADITQAANAGKATVKIDGDDVPVQEARQRIIDELNATGATVMIDGNEVPLGDAVARGIDAAQSKRALITIEGNPVPADQVLSDLIAAMNAGKGTVEVNGRDVPARAVVESLLADVNVSNGTVSVNGQDVPARAVLTDLLGALDSGKGTVTVAGQDLPAQTVLGLLIGTINRSSGTVKTYNDTSSAKWALDNFITMNNGRRINIYTTVTGSGGIASAGRLASGGVASGGLTWVGERGPEVVRGFAGGGVFSGRMGVVGERGPELVSLPPGSMVYPTGQSQQMAGDGGASGVQALQIMFGGNVDGAFATAFQMLVRTGKIQLRGVNV